MLVTFVTNPEPTRPSIPVVTHSLDQKFMARKAKARKCTAEIVGNLQAKIERQHRLVIFYCHPTSQEQSPKVHQKVCDKSS